MREDALTVEAIKSGDRERYAELIHRYERMVYAIAWSHLGQHDLCDEAAQETFIQGFRFLAALREPNKYASWIARIARNVACTLARRRRRDVVNERQWLLDRKHEATSSRTPDREESLSDVLQETLKKLPGKHRECLALFYMQERSTRECAETLGIREETFRVRLHRARNALRTEVQDQLERSLRELGPRGGLDKRVLSALPAAPIACGTFGLGGVVALAMKVLLQLTPLLLLLGWAHRQIVQNFRSAEDYRKALQRRHMPRHFAMMIIAAMGGVVLQRHCGAQTVGLVLALFILPGLFKSFLLLRVNRTGFVRANALGLAAMFLAFSLMALKGGSFYWAFLAAMLVYNIALWRTRKSMPSRRDYHLALRAAFDELGHIEEPVSANRIATPQDMHGFARFLGELFLVVDYSIRKQECVLAMPPMTLNVWQMLWPWREIALASKIIIRSDGTCNVTLSRRDWKEIRAVCFQRNISRAALEARTADTLEQAWSLFLNGQQQRAKAMLQPKADEDILILPLHELRSMKVIYIASIICAVVLLAASLLFFARSKWRKLRPEERPRLVQPLESNSPKNTGPASHQEHVNSSEADPPSE